MPDRRLHVHFLDVGQGDAIFIECPDGQQILIDGGPSPSVLLSHLGRRMPFWDHSLDLVVLTHPEDDHLGGLVEVLTRYEVGLILDSGQECASPTCDAWGSLIEEEGIPYRKAQAGMAITVGEKIRLDVLHPPSQLMTNAVSDINNNSMVPALQCGRTSGLLKSDAHTRLVHVETLTVHKLGWTLSYRTTMAAHSWWATATAIGAGHSSEYLMCRPSAAALSFGCGWRRAPPCGLGHVLARCDHQLWCARVFAERWCTAPGTTAEKSPGPCWTATIPGP